MKKSENHGFDAVKARERRIKNREKRRKATNRGYSESGASFTRQVFKNFKVSSGSPIEDIDFNNYTLRQRSRILFQSSPIATSAIKTNRTNIVGQGLKLKAHIDKDTLGLTSEQAEKIQKKIEKEFSIWAENKMACDSMGSNNFYELQQIVVTSWLMSGDVFGILKMGKPTLMRPYALNIQLVEADRVSTPYDTKQVQYQTEGRNTANGNPIHDGIEVDKGTGRVVAYWISKYYPDELIGTTIELQKWTRVEAFQKGTELSNVVHVYDAERPGAYRGVPYISQAIEPILQIRRYTQSELMAAIIESFFTGFITTQADPDEMPLNEVIADDEDDISAENDYRMGPGQFNVLKEGEDIKFADPKRPSNGFDAFVKNIATQIGASLEIPRDLLLKEFNSSYSASRAALMEAWKSFRMRRDWLANDFCKPIYEYWLSEAIARGRIDAPGFFTDSMIHQAYLGSEWIGPSQGQLDPTKEINAELLAISNGLSTHEQSTVRLNGGSWSDNVDQLEQENKRMNEITKILSEGDETDAKQEEKG